jgi:peroxiredoxin
MTDRTRRGFNWPIWAGFLLTPIAFLSYRSLFERWPITRDFPWVNLLLFGVAALLLKAGLGRAFGAERFRALKIAGSLALAGLGASVFALFVYVIFVAGRDLPASAHAPAVGAPAPAFTLPDEHGVPVSLTSLLTSDAPTASGSAASSRPRGVLLVFYMYSGCRACNSELHGLQKNLSRLAAAGIRPVAISIDDPPVSYALSQEAGYTYTFLSDPTLDVIRQYDLADHDMGARPAEFLVDASGVVRWRNIPSSVYVRATPDDVIDAARRAGL